MIEEYEIAPSKARAKKSRYRWIKRHSMLGAITITVGVISFALTMSAHQVYFKQGADEYFWEILISVPVTIICLGAFSVFYEWYIRDNFTQAIRELIGAWDTGVLVLSTHSHAPNRVEILMKARKNVKLMSTTLLKYFSETGHEVLNKIENGVKFQFIIYDPDSSGIREKSDEEGIKIKKFVTEINTVCDEYLSPWVKKYPASVSVRFCPFNTPFGVTIVDDTEMVLSLNIPGLVRSKYQTPCLWIKNRYEKDSVFKQYDESFDAIWKKLSPEYPSTLKEYFL